jgi:hypothetical protein
VHYMHQHCQLDNRTLSRMWVLRMWGGLVKWRMLLQPCLYKQGGRGGKGGGGGQGWEGAQF